MQAIADPESIVTTSKIGALVAQLRTLVDLSSPFVACVKDPVKLIAALEELDNVVGVEKVKEMVVKQTQYLLLNQWLQRKPMLHGVFYGPPGVGKTKISKIFAKIWSSMGVLRKDVVISGFGSSVDKDKDVRKSMAEFSMIQQQVDRLREAVKRYSNRLGEANNQVVDALYEVKNLRSRLKREREESLTDSSSRERKRKRHRIDVDDELSLLRSDLTKLSETTTEPTGQNAFVAPTDLNTTQGATQGNTDDDLVVVAHRGDVVAEYTGQTVPRTLRFLNKHRGKVIIFDEAYLLVTDDQDKFGLEALTTINQWADQHPEANIFVFDGYKEQLQATIFRYQPGLARRCRWVFEIDSYTASQLAKILIQQLKIDLWDYTDSEEKLISWIAKNIEAFPAFGGDMESLVFFIGQQRTNELWNASFVSDNKSSPSVQPNNMRHVTMQTVEKAFPVFMANKAVKKDNKNTTPPHWYI